MSDLPREIGIALVGGIIISLILLAGSAQQGNLQHCLEENVHGCSGDFECMDLAKEHCSEFLPANCQFEPTSIHCEVG